METPILDIVIIKPDKPKNDKLLLGYAINIIKGKLRMRELLNSEIFKN